MKKIILSGMISIFAFASGCSTVDQNINARKNLAKCKFDLEKLALNRVNFTGIEPKNADFDIYLKITNPNNDDVVLDRIDADIFLDQTKTTTINHKKFLRIKGGTSETEKLELTLPGSAIIKLAGKKPENITVDATAYVNIIIGSYTLQTSIKVKVKKTFPIPYDKIKEAIEKKKSETINSGGIKKTIMNKIK